MIMLILLTCSSMTMADDEVTVTITEESDPDKLSEKRTVLNENISQYFIWAIPSQLEVSNGANFNVKITEAHLNYGVNIKINVQGLDSNGMVQLKNENSLYGLSSKVTLKKEGSVINSTTDILNVDSCSFTETADTTERTANISISVERNPFQFAGQYSGQITFKASIS